MTDRNTQWLVVTDLDGTMLNHDSYALGDTQLTINLLKNKKIPVVLNTSKTYAETVSIRATLQLHDPFIVENGSCVYIPTDMFPVQPPHSTKREKYWAITLGKSQQEISHALEHISIPESYYTRLSRCTVEQAVDLTGLSPQQAAQAITREFTEPLIWHNDSESLLEFQNQLQRYNLTTLRGGRFLHVLGTCDKGQATTVLTNCYDHRTKTIVLGDSANDAAMLNMADISVIVNSPSSHLLDNLVLPTIKTNAVAPEGWSEGINKALLQADIIQEVTL